MEKSQARPWMSFLQKWMQNAQASSLHKDRGLGAGPRACEISHQYGDESLHTQFHSGFSTSFNTGALL